MGNFVQTCLKGVLRAELPTEPPATHPKRDLMRDPPLWMVNSLRWSHSQGVPLQPVRLETA